MPSSAAEMVHAAGMRFPQPTRLNSIVGIGFDLLVDAAAAFDAGAIFSASVGIRSAVESAGFLYLTRIPNGPGFQVVPLKTRHGRDEKPDFEDVRQGLVAAHALPKDLLAKLVRIRDNGNYIAHFASAMDARLMARFREDRERALHGQNPIDDTVWLIPFPTQVFTDLKDAIEIVLALSEKMAADGFHPVSQPSRLGIDEVQ